MISVKNIWKIIKQSFADFIAERVLKLSAALSYYTLFSLPGLLIIVIWVSEIFYKDAAVEGTIYGQIADFVGKGAALQIQETIRNATMSSSNKIATIVGFVTLLFGATSVFGEIQDSINLIWRLKAKPRKGWVKLIVNRLLSFSIIVSLGFLLLVSLIINGIMDTFIDRLTTAFPHAEVALAYSINVLITFVITSFLFGLIFKVLPDAKIKWHNVKVGAFTTAILFMLGKFLIGYYLGHSRMTTAYGAAGSIIVILLWVYYSAIILYFGAVFTRVYAIQTGSHIYPDNYAVWIKEVEVESEHSIQQEPDKKKTVVVEERKPD
ncbi:MAG: YihY/virulence factor BrkB family protein [Agriterribacter sp.]